MNCGGWLLLAPCMRGDVEELLGKGRFFELGVADNEGAALPCG
jgi:hypothetical protein